MPVVSLSFYRWILRTKVLGHGNAASPQARQEDSLGLGLGYEERGSSALDESNKRQGWVFFEYDVLVEVGNGASVRKQLSAWVLGVEGDERLAKFLPRAEDDVIYAFEDWTILENYGEILGLELADIAHEFYALWKLFDYISARSHQNFGRM